MRTPFLLALTLALIGPARADDPPSARPATPKDLAALTSPIQDAKSLSCEIELRHQVLINGQWKLLPTATRIIVSYQGQRFRSERTIGQLQKDGRYTYPQTPARIAIYDGKTHWEIEPGARRYRKLVHEKGPRCLDAPFIDDVRRGRADLKQLSALPAKGKIIVLEGPDPEAAKNRRRIEIREGRLVLWRSEGADAKTEKRFSKWRLNAALDAASFEFTPPRGFKEMPLRGMPKRG